MVNDVKTCPSAEMLTTMLIVLFAPHTILRVEIPKEGITSAQRNSGSSSCFYTDPSYPLTML